MRFLIPYDSYGMSHFVSSLFEVLMRKDTEDEYEEGEVVSLYVVVQLKEQEECQRQGVGP